MKKNLMIWIPVTLLIVSLVTIAFMKSNDNDALESNAQIESSSAMQEEVTETSASDTILSQDETTETSENASVADSSTAVAGATSGTSNSVTSRPESSTASSRPESSASSSKPQSSSSSSKPQSSSSSVSSAPVNSQPAASAPSSSAPSAPSTNYSDFQAQVVKLVNQERAARGLSPLSSSAKLSDVATVKSKDMATNNYFSHTSPTYGSPFDMLSQFGVSYSAAGENIAKGQTTPEQVMQSWMNSEGHKKNILSADFTSIGVGIAKNASGQLVWTQLFTG